MNEFFKLIGWKDMWGNWNINEIIFDSMTILLLTTIVTVTIYGE